MTLVWCLANSIEEVLFVGASDVSNSQLSELDASLAIGFDQISTHVRTALDTLDDQPVVATILNRVRPDLGVAMALLVGAQDFHPILMALLNCVLEDVRRVIDDFDAHLILRQIIEYYLQIQNGYKKVRAVFRSITSDTYSGFNISVGRYSTAVAVIKLVTGDKRPAIPSLHVDPISFTGEDLILADSHLVLGSGLQHDAAGFKVRKVAPID